MTDTNISGQSFDKIFVDTRPLHLRIEEALNNFLKGYAPGDRIPSEIKLAQIMGVSRSTIREVLLALEKKGYIKRVHGLGTFVAEERQIVESGLEFLESLDTTALRMGLACNMKNLEIRQEAAGSEIAIKMKIDAGVMLTVVKRIRTIGNAVVAYMVDAIPASIITPDEVREVFTGSILDYFWATKITRPSHAVTTILSIQADRGLAENMQVAPGTALLLLEEALYDINDRLIDYSYNYYNTAHFRYHVVRRSLV